MSAKTAAPTSRLGPLAFVVAALAVSTVIRLHRLELPLERDEGEYAYGGALILEHAFSYDALRTLKLPGVHASAAAAFALFGATKEALRGALLVADTAAVAFLFVLARPTFGAWTASLAAATMAIAGLSATLLGLHAHAEKFAVAWALLGLVLLARAFERPRAWAWLGAGLAFGASVSMKQHAIVLAIAAALAAAARPRAPDERMGRRFRELVVFWIGLVAPYGLVVLLVSVGGGFDAFWYQTVTYAREYVGQVSLADGAGFARDTALAFSRAQPGFAALALVGFLAPLLVEDERRRALALILFAFVCFLATSPGLLFRNHYFVLLAPPVAIACALGARAFARVLARGALAAREPTIAAVIVACAAAAGLWNERGVLWSASPRAAIVAEYGDALFADLEGVAELVASRTEPGETIAVLGSEPAIAFLAHRRSATGSIYMYPLTEDHPRALELQERTIAEIEAAAPRIVVYVNASHSWLRKSASPPRIFEWISASLRSKYRPLAIFDVASGERIEGDALRAAPPTSKTYVVVHERREPGSGGDQR